MANDDITDIFHKLGGFMFEERDSKPCQLSGSIALTDGATIYIESKNLTLTETIEELEYSGHGILEAQPNKISFLDYNGVIGLPGCTSLKVDILQLAGYLTGEISHGGKIRMMGKSELTGGSLHLRVHNVGLRVPDYAQVTGYDWARRPNENVLVIDGPPFYTPGMADPIKISWMKKIN